MPGSLTLSQKFSVTGFFNLAMTQTTATFLTLLNLSSKCVGKSGMILGTYGRGTVLMTLS
ncbi:hypothetical protein D3C72_2102540 [compost metagenome]